MATYRVLSLDGGGIRGIITVVLLERLAAEPGLGGWLDEVDLIAGTSTGGLLALGIGKGLDLATIEDLYMTKGRAIFDDSWLDNVVDLGKVIGADYSLKGLTRELRRVLGDTTTLGDLTKRVLIATFDLDNVDDPGRGVGEPRTWKPKLFHNFPGDSSDGGALAWKVGLYTAAAPTYFPSYEGYVDGGVYATNPAMCALAQTLDGRYGPPATLDEVVLLSIGTGTNLQHIPRKNVDWGYAQWARPMVPLMLGGVSGIADYQCRQVLGDRYRRLAPVFPEGTTYAMDDVEHVAAMRAFASGIDITGTAAWIRAHWMGT
jgi:patatin-like phospholipase/acyl hydrolase